MGVGVQQGKSDGEWRTILRSRQSWWLEIMSPFSAEPCGSNELINPLQAFV